MTIWVGWLAAVVCLGFGLRSHRASVPTTRVIDLPPWIALTGHLPAPYALLSLVDRLRTPESLRVNLLAAGLSPALAPVIRRSRICLGSLGVVGAALLGPRTLIWILLAPPLGAGLSLVVDARIRSMGNRRSLLISRAIPDLLDLLSISVEAGMALEPALALSASKLDPPLGDEIERTLDDLAMGLPRRRAYLDLAERCGGGEVGALVAALLRAEELGAPVSSALSDQADSARATVREALRQRAARATPKIQLVVALVMVPGAMLLIIGVLILELATQIGAVIG